MVAQVVQNEDRLAYVQNRFYVKVQFRTWRAAGFFFFAVL